VALLKPLVGLALGAVLFGGCLVGDNGALGHVRTSCKSVDLALAAISKAERTGYTSPRGAAFLDVAQSYLSRATGPAATAASEDGSWNALMTTLSEGTRVPLPNLVPALTRICTIAQSDQPYL